MNKIAIWTPINAKSGFGHFYRMLGLYELLQEQSYPVYYFTNKEYIMLEDVELINLNSTNIDEIINFLTLQEIKILIVDNYELSNETLLTLNKKFKLIYFDAKFTNLKIGTIINFNPYAMQKYKHLHKNTRYFLGLEYMNFRKSITQVKKTTPAQNSVFISIGGSDVSSITYKIIPYLPKEKFYNIVLGRGCTQEYLNRVINQAKKYNLDFKLYHQPNNYFEILKHSEIAIISCSTSSYEMIYFSKPFICINVIDNQNEITNYLSSKGICTLARDKLSKLSDIIKKGVKFDKNLILQKDCNHNLVAYIKELSGNSV